MLAALGQAMTDYNVRLTNPKDIEAFAEFIKDAACDAFNEPFNSARLRETPMRVNEFMHPSRLGQATATNIEVRMASNGALDFADTIIHELAHILVGPRHNHDPMWIKGMEALGLQWHEGLAKPEHFRADLLEAVRQAIEMFAKAHPELVYPTDTPIPVPDYVGMPDCPEASTEDCSFGHKVHVMQFQLDGVRWMLANPRNLLYADEPGLGKTVGMMLYINAVHPESIAVICPNNVKLVWRDHFRFWCVHKDLLDDLEVAHTALWTFSPVTIMSYESVRKWQEPLRKMKPALVIFDEFHYCKTPSSQRSKACYSLTGDKFAGLTGTPIVNYIEEAFPLIHKLDPDTWYEYGTFASQYMSAGNRFGKNLARFNERLRSTIMLRRFKKDVLKELPKKRRAVVEFEVEPDVKALIEQEKQLWNTMAGNDYESVKMLNAMRNDSETTMDDIDWARVIEELRFTRKFAFEEMARIAHMIALAKVPLAIEFITNSLESKEKVIVFGHHRDVLTKIADHFKPNSVLLLGGSGNQAEATAMATARFANDDSCTVFVAGITLAAGYSLKGSSTIIFVEEDWVPGRMTQAEDRSHGIGRGEASTSLMIHHLVFEDSLDTYKAKLTIKKQKAIDRATGKV
jgi:SNF2 family DNA or RNA helicase